MDFSRISFEKTGYFSKLFGDYILQDKKLENFYGFYPTLENFQKQIAIKQFFPDKRKILQSIIAKQYEGIKNIPKSQIDLLIKENTYTVTTGHQLNIFSGPLYFIFKIITTINLANALKNKYPSYHFIPIYWMASEDHDFEEISFFNLFGKLLKWEKSNSLTAVGNLDPKELKTIIEENSEIPDFFKDAYLHSDTLSEATRKYINHLFGDNGLIVIDPNDSTLKSCFVDIMKKDLLENNTYQIIKQQSELLKELGYKTQVSPRETNLFYLDRNTRKRLVKKSIDNQVAYQIENELKKLDKNELIRSLEKNPENFSPNVILRTLYQETILPNLAYIGGPAEIAYWLQLKSMFDYHHTTFPILIPRNFALLINNYHRNMIDKLSLHSKDLFKSTHTLKYELLNRLSRNMINTEEENTAIEKILNTLLEKSKLIDTNLQGFVIRENKKILKTFETINRKIRQAEEKKYQTAINQLIKMKEKLFPNGNLQERVENILSFYINDTQLIHKLSNVFNPLDFNFYIISL